MTFQHRILAASYHPVKAARAVGRSLGLTSADRLRVLIYHDVPPQDVGCLEARLRWLARTWNFVSPERFAAMVSGKAPIRGSNVLLTFDDGFASNRVVAERILNPMGIRALFFIVSDFVALEDREEARRFIARRMLPGSEAGALPAHLYNMGWPDLEALLDQEHSIGAHTRTHARLSEIESEDDLEREIIGSADILEKRLRVPIEHFAFTFGSLASFSERALAQARRRFRFVYSSLRGDNAGGVSPFALCRETVNVRDPKALLGAFMEGAADFHYSRSRAQVEAWIRRAKEVSR